MTSKSEAQRTAMNLYASLRGLAGSVTSLARRISRDPDQKEAAASMSDAAIALDRYTADAKTLASDIRAGRLEAARSDLISIVRGSDLTDEPAFLKDGSFVSSWAKIQKRASDLFADLKKLED